MANGKEQEPKEKKPKEQKPKDPKPKEQSSGGQKPKETKPKEQAQTKEEKGVLAAAAEAIGSTLGTLAVKTGLAHTEPTVARIKIPKLAKKNKQRLPRKEKKRARKAAGADGT